MKDLAQTYRTISNNLRKTDHKDLAADYGCASALLEIQEDVNAVISLLRRNIDRGTCYWKSDIRNRTLYKIAETIERKVRANEQ